MRNEARGFRLGIMWAAWWLHSGYGEDSLAARLIRESLPFTAAQKIARDEDYSFKRGFWSQSDFHRQSRLPPSPGVPSQETS